MDTGGNMKELLLPPACGALPVTTVLLARVWFVVPGGTEGCCNVELRTRSISSIVNDTCTGMVTLNRGGAFDELVRCEEGSLKGCMIYRTPFNVLSHGLCYAALLLNNTVDVVCMMVVSLLK